MAESRRHSLGSLRAQHLQNHMLAISEVRRGWRVGGRNERLVESAAGVREGVVFSKGGE